MGYTKVIQYGDITEIYEYEKNLGDIKKRSLSELEKNVQRNEGKKLSDVPTVLDALYKTFLDWCIIIIALVVPLLLLRLLFLLI